ncbi:hypothetical protein RA263_28685, partial [Pseudomonas syringae pv. tagetis]
FGFHVLLEQFVRLLRLDKRIYELIFRAVQLAHLEQEETLYGMLIMEQPVASLLEVHTPEWKL